MSLHYDALAILAQYATWQTIILLIALAAGFFIIPGLISLRLVPTQWLKGVFLRILWTAGAITLPGVGHALDHRDNGQYEINEIRRAGDGFEILRDGQWVEFEPHGWSRLGMQPFTVAYEKSDRMYSGVAVDDKILPSEDKIEEPDKPVTAQHSPRQATDQDLTILGDGGRELHFTGRVRAGYPEVALQEELEKDGYKISMSKVYSLMETAAVPDIAFVAGEQALKNEGGDSQMSNLALIGAVLLALPLGALTAYITIVGF